MSERTGDAQKGVDFAPRCLSIDLEVGTKDGRIHSFAAVRGDTGQAFTCRSGDLPAALAKLDDFADGTAFLLGHNLIGFDAVHLAAAHPDLRLLKLPAVDTLRLNPLAFPRNPYHHLVKHYQDGQLKRGRLNDPELDARLTLELFRDQYQALRTCATTAPDLVLAWHWLTAQAEPADGLNAFFSSLRRHPCPSAAEAGGAIERRLAGQSCITWSREISADGQTHGWALAYALAWLSVAGGSSVMPPWVGHQFPQAGLLVRRLRDTACRSPDCAWCRDRHDARKELTRWFGFSAFRQEPADEEGRPLQQAIVESAMRGEHVLGVLPTGTGKSLCYQIPALSRYDKTGSLTVVISPLVALMADQVAGLEARGISSCVAVNGLLSMPERADVLERVRLGDASILIVSPEQLRNRALRKVLAQREIGAWVLDEAHCISKWGHDFRPDYRYVARFIKEKAGTAAVPPVLCLTATAKPDVVADIIGHFREKLAIKLTLFDGGANRANLDFAVVPTSQAEKFSHIHQVLMADLPSQLPGGAIVYCSSRKRAEEVARFLREKGLAAGHFHAGLQPEAKKNVQGSFIRGELRVLAATNAFGMGIDKPDVRLVIHADIPGSLENYLQEAGRAGRDRESARCVLLYVPEDVERQFGMSARSRLTQGEIAAVLRSLRNLDRNKRTGGEVVATAGEILAEENQGAFERDSATDDTRVRTAIAWLEESSLLTREENRVQVFPSSLRVGSIEEASARLAKAPMTDGYRRQLLSLVNALISAPADEGISTDELMSVSGLNAEMVRAALYDLERLGIASNDTALTAFVHVAVERSSRKRLEQAAALEVALIDELRLAAPELGKGESSLLHLRRVTQHLKDAGHDHAVPDRLSRIIASIANDGRGEDGGVGSLRKRHLDRETMEITLQREWPALAKTAQLRRAAAERLLQHLLACLPQGARGVDLLAETTLGALLAALERDLVLKGEVKELSRLLDRALLWLHEQDVIRLNKGLAVFRPAMTIHLAQGKRGFVKADFVPLKFHYDEQVSQIHVMAEYAQKGLHLMAEALRMAMDYFALERDVFLRRWLPARAQELSRQTTPASWQAIVENLDNPVQQRIVADDREQTNVLVLAGPGAGKTRVLVHRIAYLVRARREAPQGILALAYNRHAAVEIRRRLADLIGDDARGVTVLTCHALAMRLAGVSFDGRSRSIDGKAFDTVLRQAVTLLQGADLAPEDADEQRHRLLAGFRWILVDEYQDIGVGQYDLISALAGRTLQDEDRKLTLFAVGDDDQNVYAFAGASVEFIRRFETDFTAKPAFLTENFRSTAHIIGAANMVIASARKRMKAGHPISIDSARSEAPEGGEFEGLDLLGKGRVQVLPAGFDAITQAMAVMIELQRLATLAPHWEWAGAAIIAREWKFLEPVRSFCELHRIPVQMADEDAPGFWRLRETQAMVDWLRAREVKLVDTDSIEQWLNQQSTSPWWSLLSEAVREYALETGGAELPVAHFIEWLAEWGREVRRRQTGLMLLTAHRAKGLQFDHVVVLDGAWGKSGVNEDLDAPRRLYYVAMTRARKTLALARFDGCHALLDALPESPHILRRPTVPLPPPPPILGYQRMRMTLRDVDVGYAGRFAPTHAIHGAISAIAAGEPLQVRQRLQRWELLDRAGQTVGRLARTFAAPADLRCVAASVIAIALRRREDEEPEYQDHVRCDRWEIVVPELVFAPVAIADPIPSPHQTA